jgi:hypothetical protein
MGVFAHIGIPGLGPFVAMGLFFAGAGASIGAYALLRRPSRPVHRTTGIALSVMAVGCLAAATTMPLFLHATLGITRPSTAARLEILSPHRNQAFSGNPAMIPVRLQLEGGKVVPITSLHLVPNEGHIHLYLDGSLVSMVGLEGQLIASPGEHTLKAEFVAVDHGPFRPSVVATVTFEVRP